MIKFVYKQCHFDCICVDVMPLKRKYPFGSRSRFVRKTLRRSSSVVARRPSSSSRVRLSRSIPSRNMHRFVRWTVPVVNTVSGATSESAFVWTFDNLINKDDFTTLYDRYRIDYIQCRAQLITNPDANNFVNSALPNYTNWFPKLWWCADYDDGAQETLDELKQRAKTKCVLLRPNSMYKFGVKPAILAQTYRTAVSTGYSPKWKQWIDMAQTNVPHYGIKYVIDAQSLDPLQDFRVQFDFKVYFSCKDVC